jgi:hypothetical protein
MSGRGDATADFAELLAGLFGTMVNVSSTQTELKKLKPKISSLLQKNTGVLLVARTEIIRHILTTSSHLASIEIVGAGSFPEPLVGKPRMYPKKHANQQMTETFIWVLRRKDVKKFLHRETGYYAVSSAEIKYLPFEDI